MKILLSGDTHLRFTAPARRKDDFFNTQIGKMRQCIDIYHENKCGAWLQSGDLTDSSESSNRVLSTYIEILRDEHILIHTIQGQHTLYMRNESSVGRTALGVLEAAGVVERLCPDGTLLDGVMVYGFDYGKKPDTMTLTKGRNYAVVHAMISPDKLYPDHVPIKPEDVGQELDMFDGILCGDYHCEFLHKGPPWVLNPGCLVRLTTHERDMGHQPTCYVLDTDTNELTRHEIKIAPAEDVFDLGGDDKAQADEQALQKLVSKLREEEATGLTFRDRLTTYLAEHDIDDDIASLIANGLESK